jgi:hypothetical protein
MNDHMIDLMAGDARLRRRLEAYADLRLTPDLAATSRIRARVLAYAHRQADLARADASLTIVPPTTSRISPHATTRPTAIPRRHARWRRALAAIWAAALLIALAGGTAAATRPGSALYDLRVWFEAVTLPAEPSARAVAELERLDQRISEAVEAARTSDVAGVAAALAAYERIMEEASAAVLAADDPVAAAVLETGVGRNVDVLQALVWQVPTQASEAIGRAIERAIERSGTTIDRVDAVKKPRLDAGGAPTDPTPKPTRQPGDGATAKPTKAPIATPDKPDKPKPAPNRPPDNDHD